MVQVSLRANSPCHTPNSSELDDTSLSHSPIANPYSGSYADCGENSNGSLCNTHGLFIMLNPVVEKAWRRL
jgi:hypothetical protein